MIVAYFMEQIVRRIRKEVTTRLHFKRIGRVRSFRIYFKIISPKGKGHNDSSFLSTPRIEISRCRPLVSVIVNALVSIYYGPSDGTSMVMRPGFLANVVKFLFFMVGSFGVPHFFCRALRCAPAAAFRVQG
jgi:hypothetical protein